MDENSSSSQPKDLTESSDKNGESVNNKAALKFLRNLISEVDCDFNDNKVETCNPAYIFGCNHLDLPNTVEGCIRNHIETQGCADPNIEGLGTIGIFKIADDIRRNRTLKIKKNPEKSINIVEVKEKIQIERITSFSFPDTEPSYMFSIIRPAQKLKRKSLKNVIDMSPIPLQNSNRNVCYLTKVFSENAFSKSIFSKPLSNNDSPRLFDSPLVNLMDLPLLDIPYYKFQSKITVSHIDGIPYTSFIHYIPEKERKRTMNEQFANMFPHVHITLTKLRSIKHKLYFVGKKVGICDKCISHALVYFEWMVHLEYVRKLTRKIAAATCLLYSIKIFEDHKKDFLYKTINTLSTEFRVPYKSIIEYEFVLMYAINLGDTLSPLIINTILASVKSTPQKRRRKLT